MKRRFIFILSILLPLFGNTQESILTSGDYAISGSTTLHWTIGQIITGLGQDGNTMLIQGFQQSTINVLSIFDNTYDKYEICVYPNPVSTLLSIDFESEESEYVSVKLLTSIGQEIIELPSTQSHVKIDLSSLDCGIYYLNFYTSIHLIKTYKIVKL